MMLHLNCLLLGITYALPKDHLWNKISAEVTERIYTECPKESEQKSAEETSVDEIRYWFDTLEGVVKQYYPQYVDYVNGTKTGSPIPL